MRQEYQYLAIEGKNAQEAFKRLTDIVGLLRKTCPWDKAQTHESLRSCMLEEAYEVVDAIDQNDDNNLREELGDVLLQVIFHSILAEERDIFVLSDVINDECDKMIRRHPHVFLEDDAKTIDKVLEKWENIKSGEHNESTVTQRLERVPKALPALTRSMKIQKKASDVGFDWSDAQEAFPKIKEECIELKEAMESLDRENMREELGDLLFSVVNVSRLLDIDPEEALNRSSTKFVERFRTVEKLSDDNNFKDMSVGQMDRLWREAKKKNI